MLDATELLEQDHREVEQLFSQYEQAKSPAVAEQICTELTVHSAIEEKVLYPALGANVGGGKRLARHAEHEHHEVKDAIFEVQRAGYGSAGASKWMQKIIKATTEHVQEEETGIFPKMRDDLGLDRLNKLGTELSELKSKLTAEAKTAGPLFALPKAKLSELARDRGVKGRSSMTKGQLISALRES